MNSAAHVAREAPARDPSAAGGTLDDRLFIVCALSWGSALIHGAAAIEHIHEYALHAIFFAVLAPLQLAWGILVCRRPTVRLVTAGAIASLVVVALWVMSRTSGLPIGPQLWRPEPIGASDAIATANEITLALLALAWGCARRGHTLPRGASRALATLGVLLVAVSSLSLMAAGHGS